MYRRIIQPILFALSIEQAHRAVLLLLRIIGALPGGRWLLGKCYAVRHPVLEREVFGRHFANPVGLAAGFDRNGEAVRELGALGFGFVEVGTVTPCGQPGNPRPRVFRLPKDRALVNRIGHANRGLQKSVQYLRRPHPGLLVGCNIGKNTSTPVENAAGDYLKSFRSLYQYADYFTVNICSDSACRETPDQTREHILHILEPLFDFRRGQNHYRPILLKVAPEMSDDTIDAVTDVLIETPLDGIVAIDGSLDREGLRTSRPSLLKIGAGRLSGAPLARRALEIVRRIRTRSGGDYPIIGVGGLMTPDDVRSMLAAGADLVQLYSGYIYNGPGFVKEICNALIADAGPRTPDTESPAAASADTPADVPADAQAPEVPSATGPSDAAGPAQPTGPTDPTGAIP